MKKLLSAFICFSMILIMTGCQSEENKVLTPFGKAVIEDEQGSMSGFSKEDKSADNVKEAAGDTANTDSGLIHVGFAQVGSESGWRMAQTQSMKETFTEANGYQFDFVDCNNDPKKQIETLEKFIKDKVSYIVLDPIIEKGYDDVLKKAQDAKIPVIIVDRNISCDKSLYSCWVGSDFNKEGEDAAKWLSDYLNKQGRASEDINILTILGSEGASATLGRTSGFENIAKEHDNWKLLDKQCGEFTQDGGKAVMKAFLKKYQDIDVVVCQNDDEAFGAIEAIEEAGLTCGPDGDIIIISFDATKNAFEQMIAGKIHVDVECNPLEGPLVAELIQKLHAGEKPETMQYMKEGVFTAENAAEDIKSRVY